MGNTRVESAINSVNQVLFIAFMPVKVTISTWNHAS